jgi:hypothetical protein
MPRPLSLRSSNSSDRTLDATSGRLPTTATTTLPPSAQAANEASVVNKSAALIPSAQKLYPQDSAPLNATTAQRSRGGP